MTSVIRIPEVPSEQARRDATTSALAPSRLAIALSMALALALTLVWAGSAPASVPIAAPQSPTEPETTDKQVKAAKEFAGSDGDVSTSNVLVTHSDGKFDWIVLCVGRKPDGATALIDTDGRVYDGGIDDFRAHNDLLSEDDKITFNRDIASATPGDVKLVTRSGHTGQDRTPWLLAGSAGAVVVLAGGALLLVRRARRAAGQADVT
jgi:hypothetical protein